MIPKHVWEQAWHRHMNVLIVLGPEYTWTARIFSFPTSHIMTSPWWPKRVLVYDHLSCLLTLFAVMFLDSVPFLLHWSCCMLIQNVIFTQDDVMMPQRVRLQHEAAVQHPTSVSTTPFCVSPPLMKCWSFFNIGILFLGIRKNLYSQIARSEGDLWLPCFWAFKYTSG